MPIAPIDFSAFQRNTDGLSRIMERGGSAFSTILRDAMQIGRDQSNNQARQERDFLGEQRREINLSQRKAELSQQDFEDTRRYGEDVRQFDTKFDEEVRQFGVSSDTQKAQFDATGKREDTRIGIAQSAEKRAAEAAPYQKAAIESGAATAKSNAETARMQAESTRDLIPLQKTEAEAKALQAQSAAKLTEGQVEDLKVRTDALRKGTLTLEEAKKTRDKILEEFSKAKADGDSAKAQSIYRQFIVDPALGFDQGTVDILARDANIIAQRQYGNPNSALAIVIARDYPTIAEAEDRLKVINKIQEENKSTYLSDADIEEKNTLLQHIDRLKGAIPAAPTTTPPANTRTMADDLKNQGQR